MRSKQSVHHVRIVKLEGCRRPRIDFQNRVGAAVDHEINAVQSDQTRKARENIQFECQFVVNALRDDCMTHRARVREWRADAITRRQGFAESDDARTLAIDQKQGRTNSASHPTLEIVTARLETAVRAGTHMLTARPAYSLDQPAIVFFRRIETSFRRRFSSSRFDAPVVTQPKSFW